MNVIVDTDVRAEGFREKVQKLTMLMRTMLRVTPVFEMPWYEGKSPWPWDISTAPPFSFVPILPDCDDGVLGSFFAEFAPMTDPPDERKACDQLIDIVEEGAQSRAGGLKFEKGDIVINPGCCGDLRAAQEWRQFLLNGETPWTGHDPSPWATFEEGDTIVIWSDGGLDDERTGPCIQTTRSEFEKELVRAIEILSGFGESCAQWLQRNDIPKADEINARIRADFDLPTVI